MLAAIVVSSGVDTLKNPKKRVDAAEPVTAKVAALGRFPRRRPALSSACTC